MSQSLDPRTASIDELASIYQEHGNGLSEKAMEQKTTPLGTINVAPKAFQFRDASDEPWRKSHHIKQLVAALNRQDEFLDPMLLFPINGCRIVLDGHCRLRAYRKVELDDETRVPVSYFRGDFSEAVTRPASENSKNKLPLTQREKLQAAWRLVLYDETRGHFSHRDIARVSGAGKSTVGNMRSVLREEENLGFDPRSATWREVKQRQREEREIPDDWQEKRVRRWRNLIRKALGEKPNDTPQCLFQALEEAYGQLFPNAIPREWAEESGAVDEILREREQYDDFRF